MSSTDQTEILRNKVCAEMGITVEYFEETVKMLREDRWRSGHDVDRDAVVNVLAVMGIGYLDFLSEAAEEFGADRVQQPDYTKKGSVFDD